MHELSVAMAILRTCRVELDTRGGDRLESVRIAVGELAGVEPDLLAFAWEVVGGGVRLTIDRVPAVRSCVDCGPIEEPAPGTWLQPCPRCGAPLCVSGGDVLDVIELTYSERIPMEALQ